jgi:hypothetical protein
MTPRRALPVLALLGVLAGSASAQASSGPGYSWVFHDVGFSGCVDFLIEPAFAAKQLDNGFRIVPAASFTELSPVLSREIQGDSVHLAWVPSRVCFLEGPTMTSGTTVLVPDTKMGSSEVVAFWAIAATRTEGAPRQDEWFAVTLWVNDWHAQKVTESAFIPVKMFKRSFAPVPESTRHLYQARFGKTVLSWEGDLVGRDSTAVADSAEMHLGFTGKRNIAWAADVKIRPRWTRTLPGAFRVSGKDDMAKALQASPIRFFGPMEWGGDAFVEFTRR